MAWWRCSLPNREQASASPDQRHSSAPQSNQTAKLERFTKQLTESWAYSECPDVKNYKWRLNPVWHRMIYSCTHIWQQWASKGYTSRCDRKQKMAVIDEVLRTINWITSSGCFPVTATPFTWRSSSRGRIKPVWCKTDRIYWKRSLISLCDSLSLHVVSSLKTVQYSNCCCAQIKERLKVFIDNSQRLLRIRISDRFYVQFSSIANLDRSA